jgi:Condensation domain
MPADVHYTDQITVRFSGTGAGCAPLTWGQRQALHDAQESGQTLNMSDRQPLPQRTTVGEVAAQLAGLMSRQPALRTKFPARRDGRRLQVAEESGEVPLQVVDMPDSAGEAEVKACVRDLYYAQALTPFDHTREWPLRMAVIQQRGLATYWVWTVSHMVGDATAMAMLQGELGYGTMAGRRADPKTMGLLELARLEQTPRLRRVSDRSMRYWEPQLQRVPPLTFGPARYPGRLGKRYWHGQFNSQAAYLGTLAIARRTGTDTSRVLLALLAIAIGRATGVCPLTTKVIVSNRFRPGYREIVAPISQSTAVTVDVAGVSVTEAVARARRAAMVGAMHGYFDPDQLARLRNRLDTQRGYPAWITCHINDPRIHVRQAAEEAVRTQQITVREIQGALGKTWFSWDGTVPGDYYTDQAFLTVTETWGTLLLQFVFDMACFTEAQAEGLTREVEQVAVEAAADGETPTGVVPGRARY